ncbi:hypothetical protein DA2_3380 [Desulfovibrio sp. A2]|nr:hypothetical protein DA2_3380 [Desulfovibrio sp. A2]
MQRDAGRTWRCALTGRDGRRRGPCRCRAGRSIPDPSCA